jgi:hypothetical protein
MAINPNTSVMPPFPGAPAPQENQNAGKGLAITALALAIVSLLLCWVPFVNNLVFGLGFIALGFAIAATVITVKRKSKSKGMSIAALIISVISIIGVIVSQIFYVSILDGVADSIEDAADGVVAVDDGEQAEVAEATTLALGKGAAIGNEYNVTVKAVDLDATKDILAMNQFNQDPEGQYVLIDLVTEYVGSEEGDPWIDLAVKLVGGDARQYGSSTCMASLEKEALTVPTLENGGVGEYQLCLDVPAEAIKDAKLFVEPTLSFDNDSRVYWAVK